MEKKVIKRFAWGIIIMAVACLALMLVCNHIVVSNAESKVFSEIDSIKYNKVGLLLGTTPQARITKVKNYFFIYRLDAAEQMYRARKIEKILISGDEHSLDGINEPIDDSVIMQIERAMTHKPSNWRMAGKDVYECVLSEPDLTTKSRNDVLWRISLQKDSVMGIIVYGRV